MPASGAARKRSLVAPEGREGKEQRTRRSAARASLRAWRAPTKRGEPEERGRNGAHCAHGFLAFSEGIVGRAESRRGPQPYDTGSRLRRPPPLPHGRNPIAEPARPELSCAACSNFAHFFRVPMAADSGDSMTASSSGHSCAKRLPEGEEARRVRAHAGIGRLARTSRATRTDSAGVPFSSAPKRPLEARREEGRLSPAALLPRRGPDVLHCERGRRGAAAKATREENAASPASTAAIAETTRAGFSPRLCEPIQALERTLPPSIGGMRSRFANPHPPFTDTTSCAPAATARHSRRRTKGNPAAASAAAPTAMPVNGPQTIAIRLPAPSARAVLGAPRRDPRSR